MSVFLSLLLHFVSCIPLSFVKNKNPLIKLRVLMSCYPKDTRCVPMILLMWKKSSLVMNDIRCTCDNLDGLPSHLLALDALVTTV